MATPRGINQKGKYTALNARLNRYLLLVKNVFDTCGLEVAKIAERTGYSVGDVPFRFADFPITKSAILGLQKRFVDDMGAIIYRGTSEEWKQSNLVQDLLTDKVLKFYGSKAGGEKHKVYYQTNSDVLKAFQQRKISGELRLSEVLWNQSENYKTEMEYAISSALEKGTSAVTLSKRLSKYLNDFDKLKDDYKERYGKAVDCQDCEYRSMRLARSEINMAYRTAEQERWKQMDFVLGFEIKLSKSHHDRMPKGDICDDLAGKYPKDFKWTGWHPNDMCYVVPVLKSEEDFWADEEDSVENEKVELPENFRKWFEENRERYEESIKRGTVPYFIRDNMSYLKTESVDKMFEVRNFARKTSAFKDIDDRQLKQFNEVLSSAYKCAGIQLDCPIEISVKSDSLNVIDRENFEFILNYRAEEKTIQHELFIIDNESMKGLGLSKDVYRSLYPVYEKLGAEKIIIHAGDKNGGYTWARYGFRAKYGEANSAIGRIRDDELYEKAQKILDDFYESHEKTELFPMHLIADQPWGKQALCGTKWWGEIDLTDAAQKSWYEKYIGFERRKS